MLAAGCSGTNVPPPPKVANEAQSDALVAAHRLHYQGHPDEAFRAYRALYREEPRIVAAWTGAFATASPERRSELLQDLETWLVSAQGDDRIMARTLEVALEPDLAARERRLYEIRESAPSSGWPAWALGDVFFARGSFRSAANSYERSAELNPWLPHAFLGAARSHLELSDWVRAVPPYDRYLKLRPDDAKALYNLAWILLEKQNRPRDARVLLERALAVVPGDVTILIALGKISLASEEPRAVKDALRYYEEAARVAPDDPLVQWNLGVISADHLDDTERALRHFNAYLRLGGEEVERVTRWIRELEAQKDSG